MFARSGFVTATLAVATAASPAAADAFGGRWEGGHMMVGGLTMILFWVGLIVAVILAVRYLGSPGSGNGHARRQKHDPIDILRERFARGEIDEEEYRRRRETLAQH